MTNSGERDTGMMNRALQPSFNMDRGKRIVIDAEKQPWIPSPITGVFRKPFEREDLESGEVTSIVKYEPSSAFPSHTHPNGEEILVLEGVFADEHGSYPAGSYLRNPPGSTHKPRSEEGCTLLVKLNSFRDGDNATVNINTGMSSWVDGLVDGLSVLPLQSYATEHTALVDWEPGTVFKPHTHIGGEEIYVISGELEDEFGRYSAGTWLRSPVYSRHSPRSPKGCTLYVKTGHLATL